MLKGPTIRSVVGFVVVLGGWQLLAVLGVVNTFLLPPPSALLQAALELAGDGSLWRHVGASLQRVVVGFLIAAVAGIALGVLLGWSRVLSELIRPIVESVRPIPPIAWTPIAILWFGVGNAPSYFLVFIGAVFPVFVNTFAAVRGIDRNQVNAALCLGARPWLLIRDVLIPASLPVIFPGLRIALGIGGRRRAPAHQDRLAADHDGGGADRSHPRQDEHSRTKRLQTADDDVHLRPGRQRGSHLGRRRRGVHRRHAVDLPAGDGGAGDDHRATVRLPRLHPGLRPVRHQDAGRPERSQALRSLRQLHLPRRPPHAARRRAQTRHRRGIRELGFADLSDALRAGKIESLFVWDPWIALFETQGLARVLKSDVSLTMVVAMRDDFIKTGPDVVERFLRAHKEALFFAARNRELANEWFREPEAARRLDLKIIEDTTAYDPQWNAQRLADIRLAFTPEEFERYKEAARVAHELKVTPRLSPVAERTDMRVAMRLDQTPWAFDPKSVKVERR